MKRAKRALFAALLALCVAGGLAPSAGAEAIKEESTPTFESQLNGGHIREATINKRARSVHLLLTDGNRRLVKYPRGQEPKVYAELQAKHVPVAVLSKHQANQIAGKRPIHHKLRYIVGGIVIAVVVIGGGLFLYRRRGRD